MSQRKHSDNWHVQIQFIYESLFTPRRKFIALNSIRVSCAWMQKRHSPINPSQRSDIWLFFFSGKTNIMFALQKEVSTECSNIIFLGDRNVKVVKTANRIWSNREEKKVAHL